jgi:hypothetical protein
MKNTDKQEDIQMGKQMYKWDRQCRFEKFLHVH